MASGKRTDRLADQIKEVVSEIIQRKVKDPHVGFVTITGVTLTRDLRDATVFYSVFGDTVAQKSTNRALESAKGFIQTELAREVRIRRIPQINFKVDRSAEQGARIESLLNQIHEKDEHSKDDQD
jgi:ribosome-binding factor A